MSGWYAGEGFGSVMGVQAAALAGARASGPAVAGALHDAVGGYALPMALLTLALAAAALLGLVSERLDPA